MTPILRVAGATVEVGQSRILNDASLELFPGRVTAVIGPNGAGKSTLLAVASGQKKPSGGEVLLGDEDLSRLPARLAARRRAVMPQNSTVAFPFTVRAVVAMGRTPWGRSPRDEEIVDDVLRRNQLTEFSTREVTTLSGGERQRVAFARVMAQATPLQGQVILLDEPTAAMDIAHAEHTLSLVRALAAQGAAVGIVLHDLDAAVAYADELVLMERGYVRAQGQVAEVCQADALSSVYRTPIEVYGYGGRLRVGPVRGT